MDVTIRTTRGERQFASGDRIMFLRNERGLGVKNGTLATIEQVTPQRMAVRTDDGRNAAFDTKDYAHIDHGYAATIHKAQGMTVDRAHVLATPGMDSHGAYVAMSRHRDGVDLHYGRDDFADQSKLVRTLSRERGKDMASDYKPEQRFAERRGITFRDLRDCYVRAVLLSAHHLVPALYEEATKGPDAVLCENDLYGFDLDELDPIAIVQNMCCEIEKIMGIFPNVPRSKE